MCDVDMFIDYLEDQKEQGCTRIYWETTKWLPPIFTNIALSGNLMAQGGYLTLPLVFRCGLAQKAP